MSSEMGVMDCDSRPSYTAAGSGRPDLGVTKVPQELFPAHGLQAERSGAVFVEPVRENFEEVR